MDITAIVDPAVVTWSKYNLEMRPTQELGETYKARHGVELHGAFRYLCFKASWTSCSRSLLPEQTV